MLVGSASVVPLKQEMNKARYLLDSGFSAQRTHCYHGRPCPCRESPPKKSFAPSLQLAVGSDCRIRTTKLSVGWAVDRKSMYFDLNHFGQAHLAMSAALMPLCLNLPCGASEMPKHDTISLTITVPALICRAIASPRLQLRVHTLAARPNFAVVGELDGFSFGIEGCDRQHWPKGLFLDDTHFWSYISQQRWSIKAWPKPGQPPASSEQTRAALDGVIHVASTVRNWRSLDQRAHLHLGVQSVAHAHSRNLVGHLLEEGFIDAAMHVAPLDRQAGLAEVFMKAAPQRLRWWRHRDQHRAERSWDPSHPALALPEADVGLPLRLPVCRLQRSQ